MENSPLNKAHQLDRRAEALLKQKKFDESIESHHNAMHHLHEALHLTQNPRSLESIHLQIDHHQKQVDSLKIKKLQYEDLRRYQESMRNRVNFDCICENGESLQTEIFRTIETHDSLIEVMMKRNCPEECPPSVSDTMKASGKKREVDDSTLLEEFKGLSEKLREFVQILVLQLEEKDTEIARLKAEIYKLECEKNKDGAKTSSTLRVVTDSSGGTSPYVFSPCSELSPEVGLPPLAPLEMPNFDFSTLVKNGYK
ncbi:uncharacterized protein LOC123007295 [Tribolium madens]|uniref:uncharacterized protein LOC123007295 n=1 Tax=Tribolium madens TaxID=41895 RepID=UPI001CF72508|nr:uncharacterized protein LOC123007295 [Tribolium madens]